MTFQTMTGLADESNTEVSNLFSSTEQSLVLLVIVE